ncbi:MAG TPA: ATP-binding protein [Tepidisphaeraceae bacterium]|jgi:transitional endoplasmic reticulum ATPase|nr:ATP-binding protein [Tepidisphaeraceae bacterium]
MSVSWETFERYRQKGLDARRAGQWDSARIYLLEAARAMAGLSKGAMGEELRESRKQMAERLLELARDCETAAKENRRAGTVSRARGGSSGGGNSQASESEGEASAQQWIVKEKSTIRFADVAGLEDVKEDIRLKMIYPFEHPELAEKFGIRAGGGVLMYGPPGTGKTMLAKATAGEIEATFFRISPADVLSKWVGEAEQNIKKLFDAAAGEKRSIIFIDEIEALVPARRDEGSSVMQRVVPQILQGVEGFDKKAGRPILLMGATNVPWQLDPAMMRPGRFDEKVYIPLPDLPARRKMLDIYLSKRPLAANLDLDTLAQKLEGFSGADIKYLCDRSATIPFLRSVASGEDGEITSEILAEVINETQPSVTGEMLKRFEEWAKSATAG